jgi:hypothetical protein
MSGRIFNRSAELIGTGFSTANGPLSDGRPFRLRTGYRRRRSVGFLSPADSAFPPDDDDRVFHLSMAYAILRRNGVEVGKMDFLGPMNFVDA